MSNEDIKHRDYMHRNCIYCSHSVPEEMLGMSRDDKWAGGDRAKWVKWKKWVLGHRGRVGDGGKDDCVGGG